MHDRMSGTVTTRLSETGVIAGTDGLNYLFHRTDAPTFDQLRVGVSVFFSPSGGKKGPRAKQIHIDQRT
jgi:cold shock CspA family protein